MERALGAISAQRRPERRNAAVSRRSVDRRPPNAPRDGSTVEPTDDKSRPAFPTPPVGSPSTSLIADTRAVAAHQSIKGWITIDGTDGFLPAALVYTDGDEVLRIRFQGDWL